MLCKQMPTYLWTHIMIVVITCFVFSYAEHQLSLASKNHNQKTLFYLECNASYNIIRISIFASPVTMKLKFDYNVGILHSIK